MGEVGPLKQLTSGMDPLAEASLSNRQPNRNILEDEFCSVRTLYSVSVSR